MKRHDSRNHHAAYDSPPSHARRYLLLSAASLLAGAQAIFAAVTITPQTHIVVDPAEPQPVHRAISDLQRDFETVLGRSPTLVHSLDDIPDDALALVVVGPAWSDARLATAADLAGHEAHAVYLAKSANPPRIVLHGSDMRGTIYAIYTFSQHCLEIPPLWFWASWQPQHRRQIELPDDFCLRFDPPDVRWRAWFPNDQHQLSLWRARNPDYRDTFAKTMLRLKLNVLDVGATLDPQFSEPYKLDADAEMAQRFGLAVTATHTAPLGAHPAETRWNNYWTRVRNTPPPKRSIYDKDSLIDYWKYHIDAILHHDVEMIWPIAFRGAGDRAFWEGDNYEDPGSDPHRARVIREMLDEQIRLLKAATGSDNPPMRLTLYNEKSRLVAAGLLELPVEPSLIYNFVAARRDHYPPPDLLGFNLTDKHLAGYYFNYQFTSTGSHLVQAEGPWKMERNFRTVNAKSPTGIELSVVNAGNVREHVMELAANAQMMWDLDAYDSSAFLREFCSRYFGPEHGDRIARFCADYYQAYWRQRPPDLQGFDRQYIFQDLRLQRTMSLLTAELGKTDPDLNPFWSGDWFRIDPQAHGAENEVHAVVIGMRHSLERLEPLTIQADEILASLPASRRAFFNDNFRVQAWFLRYASETLLHLAQALLAQSQGRPDQRTQSLRLAAMSAENMENILAQAEHDQFAIWYEPLRSDQIRSVWHIRRPRQNIQQLLTTQPF